MTEPFPDFKDTYASSGAAMREASVEPSTQAANLATLSGEVDSDRRRLGGFVDGEVRQLLYAVPTPAQRQAALLAANTYYAVGLIKDFAGDADTFDATVTALNARHDSLVRAQIRWLRGQPDQPAINRSDVSEHIRGKLHPDYLAALEVLRGGIRQTRARFVNGPDDTVTTALIVRGLIPLSAAGLYPGVRLTPLDIRLAQLASGIAVPLPPGTTPAEVLSWWRSLDPSARTDLIARIPEFVGNTDGIPAADRNTANRARLPGLIEEQEQYVRDHPDDKAAAEDLAGLKTLRTLIDGSGTVAGHPDYQLLLLDGSGHPLKAALSNGPVDDADIVSTWIGGTTSTVKGFAGDMARMNNLSDEVARQLALNGDPRTQVGVLWLGYDAPDNIVDPERRDAALGKAKESWKGWFQWGDQHGLEDAMGILLKDGGDTQDAINTRFAKDGAPALARFAEGIRATNPGAVQTGSAHSYGGAVLGGAAQDTDAYTTITVSGAPGMMTTDRSDLRVEHVYVSEAQWKDQDYSGVTKGFSIDTDKVLELLKDGGDFVPDIGQLDHRFGSDPSDLDGVTLFDNGDRRADGRDLTHAHGHSSYWDKDSSSLYNEANSIIDRRDKVATR